MRIGIVGLGEVTEFRLLPALAQIANAEVTAITGRTAERATEVAKKFSVKHAFTSYTTMLKNCELDAVIVATPDHMHAEMALLALEHDCHVFIEKPMATRIDDARLLRLRAFEKAKNIAVGYHLRHHAGHRLLMDKIVSGVIGRPKHVHITWSYTAPPNDWRSQPEYSRWWAIAAVGTHAVDLASWLLQMPEQPKVTCVREADPGKREHDAEITLVWANNISAQISISNRRKLPRMIKILGDKGYGHAINTLGAYGKGEIVLNGKLLEFVPVDPYYAELKNFISTINDASEPVVNALVGEYNVAILEQVG